MASEALEGSARPGPPCHWHPQGDQGCANPPAGSLEKNFSTKAACNEVPKGVSCFPQSEDMEMNGRNLSCAASKLH